MTMREFKEAIVAAEQAQGVKVYHILAAPDSESRILCWQELGHKSQFGNDAPVARIQRVQLDYFTTTEYDEHYKQIEATLRELNCGFTHEGKTYDEIRKQWRDIWTVRFLEVV